MESNQVIILPLIYRNRMLGKVHPSVRERYLIIGFFIQSKFCFGIFQFTIFLNLLDIFDPAIALTFPFSPREISPFHLFSL